MSELLSCSFPVLSRHDVERSPSEHALGLETPEGLHLWAAVGVAALGIHLPDEIGVRLYESLVPLLALSEGLLRPPSLGRIMSDDRRAPGRCLFVGRGGESKSTEDWVTILGSHLLAAKSDQVAFSFIGHREPVVKS